MVSPHSLFEENEVLSELKHYLPSQAPLKDFIHHNTLHAFQHIRFHEALSTASKLFGYKVYLRLDEYRDLYKSTKIPNFILESVISTKKGVNCLNEWKERLLNKDYDTSIHARIGLLRSYFKNEYKINLDKEVSPLLFRIVSSYLDQGVSIWSFPISDKGFLDSIRTLEKNSFSSLFTSKRVKHLLLNTHCKLSQLLKILIGDESLYERYLFDQQFIHPGWSGIVSVLEDQPQSLLDQKKITLHDFIALELLLEIDALDKKMGEHWAPLGHVIKHKPVELFSKVTLTELDEVYALWQEAFEWSYYDQVLAAIKLNGQYKSNFEKKSDISFQALFCIDDRECSLRRYVEKIDKSCKTYGTPGFFNVEFYFQPEDGKFYTKLCPAPVNPKFLIREIETKNKRGRDTHFAKQTHSLFMGWLMSQTLGFWSAFKLALNIFKPSISPASVSAFKHMDKYATLTIENNNPDDKIGDLQIGFTIHEMTDRVEGLLKSIGLVADFAPIVYVVGHGASSVNNTHYAGYDCGACSGRPGSVNSRVVSFMANHPKVRLALAERGIIIPDSTQFIGALHDTTRDEIEFYDEKFLSDKNKVLHQVNVNTFNEAVDYNAKERSRRFVLMNAKEQPAKIHKKVKLRSVSLFEPRPELNHATNTLCIIGRREMTQDLFLDRRSFMNSYDYRVDPDGKYLFNILKAAAPVCGGINLEYYFSRVDNYKLGAGTKLPHNVMGLIGVANGLDGDLRTGLPSQMIEVHDPLRLLIIVEHFPDVVLKTIKVSDVTYEWFGNEWIHLVAVHPDTHSLFYFKEGIFSEYNPITLAIDEVDDIMKLIESSEENLPVYILKK